MSSFTGPLDTRRVGKHVVLLRDLSFYLDNQPDGRTITAPKGFRSDGASIPTMLRWLAGHPFGDALRSAIIHDHLYCTHLVDRSMADRIMRHAMVVEKVGFIRRWLIWSAVRCGGFWAWRKSPTIPHRHIPAELLDAGWPH